jgi:WD40 repeat protein
MALRRRSDLEETNEAATPEVGSANGSGPSNTVRKFTGILSRSSTPGKDRKDSRQSLDVPQISVRPSFDRAQRSKGTRPDTPPESNPRPSTDTFARQPSDTARKRGVAFLTLLGVRGGRKKDGGDGAAADDDDDDGASNISEYRADGAPASPMPTNAAGFTPHHKEPPKYVRMRPHNTKAPEFSHLFLAQELSRAKPQASSAPLTTAGKRVMHSDDSVWAVEISKDGRFLAAAGQDMVVRVYAMLTTPEERRTYEDEVQQGSPDGERLLRAPVFRTTPVREYRGHTGSIHDLAWSKNNFLLSASSDKTVRLWYPFLPDCLHVFDHKDSVMSIAFHPTDDRFFLAGSQDCVLRLWSIPDKEVAFEAQESDMITAVAFAPDGKTCMGGLMSGDCIFYDTRGLARQTQIQVRSSRGKNSRGSKITSIQAMAIPPDAPNAEVKVLISSNDSRIRVYNLADKSLVVKLKGHENSCSNVKARFSDDGQYIVSGSEDRRTFIWPTAATPADKDKRPCESFVAHSGAVTAAVIAPRASRLLLSASGDPVYDLCNPPPVTLMSMAEATASHSIMSSDDPPETPNRARRMEESPAYRARSEHPDGNIIITADRTGQIRVFRQDCASVKRRVDPWELSAARLGLSSRAASIATRTSAGSRAPSRRNSLVGNAPNAATLTPQHSSERINVWRNGVVEHGGRMRPVSLPPSIVSMSLRSDRSASPSKRDTIHHTNREPSNSVSTLASDARRQLYAGMSSPLQGRFPQGSPASSIRTIERTSAERANAIRAAAIALTSPVPQVAVSPPVVGLGLGEASGLVSPPRISLEPEEEAEALTPDVLSDVASESIGDASAADEEKPSPAATAGGNSTGGIFSSFLGGMPKWRTISSGLRILTPASSPTLNPSSSNGGGSVPGGSGLSPRAPSFDGSASPTKSDLPIATLLCCKQRAWAPRPTPLAPKTTRI